MLLLGFTQTRDLCIVQVLSLAQYFCDVPNGLCNADVATAEEEY